MPALTQANDLVRARNVSASECYAILPAAIEKPHPYSSPQRIFDRLTSNALEQRYDQTEAMALGVFFEPQIARYAAQKLGLKLRANTRTIEHRKVNLCATPDYLILNQPMLMEVKLSSIFYGWSEDDLHPWYEYQARAQMACTNRDVCIIVALVGSAFFTVPVVRDAEKEAGLLDAVDTFMHTYVLPGIRPPEPEQSGLWATVTSKGK